MNNSESLYQKPDSFIGDLLSANGFSQPILNWQKTALIKAFYEETPAMEYVSRPQMKLAGARFNPKNYTSIATFYIRDLWYFDMQTKQEKRIDFPIDSILREVSWAPDGQHIAVSVESDNAHEVWLVSIPSLEKFKIPAPPLNAVINRTITWVNNVEILLGVRTPHQQTELKMPTEIPRGPVIQQTLGEVSQNRTFADLLKNPQEADLFASAIEMQLMIYNLSSKNLRPLGPPGYYAGTDFSPNREFLLVQRLEKPFSFVVPFPLFQTCTDVWNSSGEVVKTIVRKGPFEKLPIHGVPTGIRGLHWASNEPQSLMYVAALDQGDWAVAAEYRDELFRITIKGPQDFQTESLLKIKNRFEDIKYLEKKDHFFVEDYERDRQWVTTVRLYNQQGGWKIQPVFSLSTNNDYENPGRAVSKRNEWGRAVVAIDQAGGEAVYLAGAGASPEGERPFLRRMNLETLATEEIFRSQEKTYESFLTFLTPDFKSFLTSFETPTQSPRVLIRRRESIAQSEVLYADPNPYEVFARLKKEVISYKRKDGVLLSGLLYYPLDYVPGTKYPAIIQAYPLEYTDASTAGQVRGSQERFVKPFREDIVYNALRGYVVLNRAQMPIIGHPETKNDTFIEQLVSGAEAAVDTLDERGLILRDKVGIIGHSYGGFMVGHLLTHSSLFATGIAKSGAYNRTLTPFGFQGERRPFWKAKETYLRMSPFIDADKMKKPILLMHGMIDNNPGTYTMQTERYFEALKGQGAIARLVLLPEESHGYAARETIGHVLWEIFTWFDRYLKN